MPNYTITAKREIKYEFDVLADSQEEALEEINRIANSEDLEEYAYEWSLLQVLDTEEVED